MHTLTTLSLYSDSEEDEDDEMEDQSNTHNSYTSSSPKSDCTLNNNIYDSINIFKALPSIPLSPDTKPNAKQQQNIINMMKTYTNNVSYFESTFNSANFVDNPKFTENTLNTLNLFKYDDVRVNKLDEYGSSLSLSIFNPISFLDKEDNVDHLMRLLDEKIRENQRKIQEKKERKEKQKQLLKEQNEKRTTTSMNGINVIQKNYMIHNVDVLNAAKQAVLAKKNEFIINSKRKNDLNKKNSRWDDEK